MKKGILVVALVTMVFGYVNAQIVTDRPDQTESSSTIGPGDLQIEGGILVAYEADAAALASNRQFLLPTNLLRYGLTDWIELRFVSQFETGRISDVNVQGISDLQIGIKIQLLQDENKNAEIALLSHFVFPTGTQELTAGVVGMINKLCMSYDLSDNVGLGYNVGLSYLGEDIDLTYTLALGTSVNDKVGIYIEPYGQVTEFEEFVLNFDTGFTYLANDNLQLDFSFGTGVTHNMNYISVGASWLMERKSEVSK